MTSFSCHSERLFFTSQLLFSRISDCMFIIIDSAPCYFEFCLRVLLVIVIMI